MSSKVHFSVIICTHNRSSLLQQCLESLIYQTLPSDAFEIIVVDNASVDDTPRVVSEFENLNGRVHYIREERVGLSHARNTGVAGSQGEILVFIDDDAVAAPGWLEGFAEVYDLFGADCVGGRVVPRYEKPKPAWLDGWRLLTVVGYSDFGDQIRILDGPNAMLPGGNMSFKRKVYESIGEFDTNLGRKGRVLARGEDDDYFARVRQAGFSLWYSPEALIWHWTPAEKLSHRYFIRSFFQGAQSQAYLNPNGLRVQQAEDCIIFTCKALNRFLHNRNEAFICFLDAAWHLGYFVGLEKQILAKRASLWQFQILPLLNSPLYLARHAAAVLSRSGKREESV